MSTTDHKHKVVELNDVSLQQALKEHKMILVDFWAPWCRPCIVLGPIIEEVAQAYQEKVMVVKVNIDENSTIATQVGFKTIPTLVIFKDGKQVESFSGGGISAKEIGKKLDQVLGK